MCGAVQEHGTPSQQYIYSKIMKEKHTTWTAKTNEHRNLQMSPTVTVSFSRELSTLLEMGSDFVKLNYIDNTQGISYPIRHKTKMADPCTEKASERSSSRGRNESSGSSSNDRQPNHDGSSYGNTSQAQETSGRTQDGSTGFQNSGSNRGRGSNNGHGQRQGPYESYPRDGQYGTQDQYGQAQQSYGNGNYRGCHRGGQQRGQNRGNQYGNPDWGSEHGNSKWENQSESSSWRVQDGPPYRQNSSGGYRNDAPDVVLSKTPSSILSHNAANFNFQETVPAVQSAIKSDLSSSKVVDQPWQEPVTMEDKDQSKCAMDDVTSKSGDQNHITVVCCGEKLGSKGSKLRLLAVFSRPNIYIYNLNDGNHDLLQEGDVLKVLRSKAVTKVLHNVKETSHGLLREYDVLFDGSPVWDIALMFEKVILSKLDLEQLKENFEFTFKSFKSWAVENEEWASKLNEEVVKKVVRRGKLMDKLYTLCISHIHTPEVTKKIKGAVYAAANPTEAEDKELYEKWKKLTEERLVQEKAKKKKLQQNLRLPSSNKLNKIRRLGRERIRKSEHIYTKMQCL